MLKRTGIVIHLALPKPGDCYPPVIQHQTLRDHFSLCVCASKRPSPTHTILELSHLLHQPTNTSRSPCLSPNTLVIPLWAVLTWQISLLPAKNSDDPFYHEISVFQRHKCQGHTHRYLGPKVFWKLYCTADINALSQQIIKDRTLFWHKWILPILIRCYFILNSNLFVADIVLS